MGQKKSPALAAHLAVISANIIFGTTFSVVKLITPAVIQPLALNVLRIAGSLFLFWLLLLFKPAKPRLKRKDIPLFILCAVTGVAINQIFYIKGISYTTPIHGALLMLITPIMITFIAAWLLKERITLLKLTGLSLGLIGSIILIARKENTATGSNMLLGDLMMLLNAASYAFYLVLIKPLMKEYSPVEVIRWVFTFGAFFIIPIGWHDLQQTDWSLFDSGAWWALGFIVIGATFLAYLFNMYGVKALGASVTGAYIYSQPFFAATIAILVMGESLTAYKIGSAFLIFGGVFLATYRRTSDSSDNQKTRTDAPLLPENQTSGQP